VVTGFVEVSINDEIQELSLHRWCTGVEKLIALFDLLECIGYEWDSRRILPAIQQSVLIQGA
jgi:hypothetical protein